jgi:hypothetical protein
MVELSTYICPGRAVSRIPCGPRTTAFHIGRIRKIGKNNVCFRSDFRGREGFSRSLRDQSLNRRTAAVVNNYTKACL